MGVYTGTVPTFLAGELPDADKFTEISNLGLALTTAWTTWTPTLTNLTLGSGTQVAKYRRIGKTIDFRWRFVYGSGSAVGTDPTITLPVQPSADYPSASGDGLFPTIVHLVDSGTTARQGATTWLSPTTLRLLFWNATPALAQITATAPWTWTTNDWLSVTGRYYAA